MEQNETTIHEALIVAVEDFDLEKVKECLAKGADPNYARVYECDNPLDQPDTSLRMVVFRISDCMLEEEGLKTYVEIARTLILHGADPIPAIQLAESRYGKYNADQHEEGHLLKDVYRVIYLAGQQK